MGVHYRHEYNGNPGNAHGWRAMAYEDSFFAHNYWLGRSNGEMSVHFRTCSGQAGGGCTTRDDNHNIVAYNKFYDDSNETIRTLSFWNSDGSTRDSKYDYIIEGNVFTYGATQSRPGPVPLYIRGINRASVRNNIIDLRGLTSIPGASISVASDDRVAQNIDVYNNTVVSDQLQTQTALNLASISGGSGLRARNNLGYELVRTSGGSSCNAPTCSNNVLIYGSTQGCPFRGTNDACNLSATGENFDFRELRIRSSGGSRALVVNQGFNFPDTPTKGLVVYDSFGGCRGTANGGPDNLWDIGAHEFGASTCIAADVVSPTSPGSLRIQ
jgi:hypothetical protein